MIISTPKVQQRIILTHAYADYSKGLYRYAVSKTSNEALADDLVQNTFVKTWSYLERGEEIARMESFLYHVLKALIIDEYRKRKSTSLDTLLEKGFEPSLDDIDRQIDIVDGAKVMALIAELPPLYQEVMWLRYMKELSLKEIAEITGQSRNAIAVQSYRGLEKLKALHETRIDACSKSDTRPLVRTGKSREV